MNTLEMLTTNLQATRAAYTTRIGLVAEMVKAETRLTADRLELEAAKVAILTANADDPKALGGNEAARSARLADLTAEEARRVQASAAVVDALRAELEMARLECRLADLTLQHLTAMDATRGDVEMERAA